MPTTKMTKFMTKNKTVDITNGIVVTKEGHPAFTKAEMGESDRIRYRFADGETMTLTDKDRASAPAFNPRWVF